MGKLLDRLSKTTLLVIISIMGVALLSQYVKYKAVYNQNFGYQIENSNLKEQVYRYRLIASEK